MAYYAALLSAIELLEDILHPRRFPNSFVGDARTFNSLHQKFSKLLDVLHDYSSTTRSPDPMEARIRDASYQALDVIESQIHKHPHLPLCPQLVGGFDWKEELQKVGEEVDSIVAVITEKSQRDEHVSGVSLSSQKQQQQQQQSDVSDRDTNAMVGFEELVEIKEKLCGSSPKLHVIPIVGMGGIGKTTLARHTFDDPLIVSRFDIRGWVTVSQDYDVVRVLQDIEKSLGIIIKLSCESSGDEDEDEDEALVEDHERQMEIAMKDDIHKHLKWRKFLIIIDDIWSTQVWDDIMHIFPDDCNGSRILLTTRLEDVAEYSGCIDSIHHMQFLDDYASWILFQEKAFGKDPCPSELVKIGKCIVSKCRGLPIAIVVIAGILSNNKTQRYWKNVAKDVGSVLIENNEHLSNILFLSYNHLPHHLKPCFLHMGSFPEDYEFNIKKLIKLWIAEGFLQTVSKSKNFEDIGEDYLEGLVKRNLVIITKKKTSGEYKSCVMHDVLRDFCRKKGRDDQLFHIMDEKGCLKTNGVEKVRRIFADSFAPFKSWAYYDGNDTYTRSIYHFKKGVSLFYVDSLMLDNTRRLRILDEAHLSTPRIMSVVSNMSHLKYLVLHLDIYMFQNFEWHIHPSISNLQNLETLIIDFNHAKPISFPSEIWKMCQLKYLVVDTMRLPPIPPDLALQKLEYLHTLATVEDLIFTNEVTQMIPNVRKLKIQCSSIDDGTNYIWSWYRLKNLVNLLHLETLHICAMCFLPSQFDFSRNRCMFPQNLKKLSLDCCKLSWMAMTLVGSLKNLQVLKLRDEAFVGSVWKPVEGEFLELKFLLMEWLDLKRWRAKNTHFPKLQHLKIRFCVELKEIPGDIGDIGTLKSITVDYSEKAGESAKKIQEEQQELGNYGLQVTVRIPPHPKIM